MKQASPMAFDRRSVAERDPELLERVYRGMTLIRAFELAVNQLFLKGVMPGTIHLSHGQEAVPVGVCCAIGAQDFITLTHRGHGQALAKGVSPRSLMAELFGRETGCCRGRGAQHANAMEGFFFHVPGIKVVTPATPYDAKGLLKSAIRDDNPVVFCVHKHLYGSKGRKVTESQLSTQYVPEDEYTIPLGVADVKRKGEDVTVVANLVALHHALNAAEALAAEGISLEVLDPRTLAPFDDDAVLTSVRKTGRLVVVEESTTRAGWGDYVVALVATRAAHALRAPPVRIASPDVPMPFAPVLEAAVLPGQRDIEDAVRRAMAARGGGPG